MNEQTLQLADTPTEESETVRILSSLAAVHTNLQSLNGTNTEVLRFFHAAGASYVEQIQELKTELFELNIKIEELQKTKEIYTLQSDSRKDIFSPQPVLAIHQGKGTKLQSQIEELLDVKNTLEAKILRLESEQANLREHTEALEASAGYIREALRTLPGEADITGLRRAIADKGKEEKNDTALLSEDSENVATLADASADSKDKAEDSEGLGTFRMEALEDTEDSEDTTTSVAVSKDLSKDVLALLNFWQEERKNLAGEIREHILLDLENRQNKFDVLKWLIQSDPTRARLTLQELGASGEDILKATEQICESLEASSDRPLWIAIEAMMDEYKKAHPDCQLDATVDCSDCDMKIAPMISLITLRLIKEIMDNAYAYSNATKILVKVYLTSRMIDVYVNDNGVGIPEEYLAGDKKSGGLHKLYTFASLLQGKASVDGDIISGTNVRFSYPLIAEED